MELGTRSHCVLTGTQDIFHSDVFYKLLPCTTYGPAVMYSKKAKMAPFNADTALFCEYVLNPEATHLARTAQLLNKCNTLCLARLLQIERTFEHEIMAASNIICAIRKRELWTQ